MRNKLFLVDFLEDHIRESNPHKAGMKVSNATF